MTEERPSVTVYNLRNPLAFYMGKHEGDKTFITQRFMFIRDDNVLSEKHSSDSDIYAPTKVLP